MSREIIVQAGDKITIDTIPDLTSVSVAFDGDYIILGEGEEAKRILVSDFVAPIVALAQMSYGGLATTGSAPGGPNTWYFAGPGTFANFPDENGEPIALTENLNVVSWDGTKASVQGVPVDVSGFTPSGGFEGTTAAVNNLAIEAKNTANLADAKTDKVNDDFYDIVEEAVLDILSGKRIQADGTITNPAAFNSLNFYKVKKGQVIYVSYLFQQNSVPVFPLSNVLFFKGETKNNGVALSAEVTANPQWISNFAIVIPDDGYITIASRNDYYTDTEHNGKIFLKILEPKAFLSQADNDVTIQGGDDKVANAQVVADLVEKVGIRKQVALNPVAEFINKDTGLPSTNSNYSRSEPIQISNLNDALVTVGNIGANVAPIAYYSSDEISEETYLGYEIATVTPGDPNAKLIENYSPNPPIGATHFVVSGINDYGIKVTTNVGGTGEDAKKKFTAFDGISQNAKFMKERKRLQEAIIRGACGYVVFKGQSNTVGRIPVESIPEGILDEDLKLPGYFVQDYVTGDFVQYQVGVNNGRASDSGSDKTSMTVGPDLFFAKKWLDDHPGIPLYATIVALSGVPISEKGTPKARWQPMTELIAPGDEALVLKLADQVRKANQWFAANNIDVVLIGEYFVQGEADANTSRAALGSVEDYPVNCANWISYTRSILGFEDLLVINSEILPTGYPASATINSIFADLNKYDPFFMTVKMAGHETSIGDGLHYDAAAGQYAGEQMYNMTVALYPILLN